MSLATHTIVGVFTDYAKAQSAASELISQGFNRDEVSVTAGDDYAREVASGNAGITGVVPEHHTGGGISGFFNSIFGSDETEDEERVRYSEAVRGGSAIVAVTTTAEKQDRAAEILNSLGAVDVDERSVGLRKPGLSGDKLATKDGETLRERENVQGRTLPVVREELEVGKRAVQKGGVRIYNRVREEPVAQDISLRDERVRVERVATDRPATEADLRSREEVLEFMETSEEAVVGKRSRVVEEVVVGKETIQRTETVRDTLHHTDVNVEKVGVGDRPENSYTNYDADYRRDFDTQFGRTVGAQYQTYAPAYQYGSRMASDDRYKSKSWSDIESTLKTDYERNNANSKWDQMKGAVRYGWEKVTGKR